MSPSGAREDWQLRLQDWARHPRTHQNLLEAATRDFHLPLAEIGGRTWRMHSNEHMIKHDTVKHIENRIHFQQRTQRP